MAHQSQEAGEPMTTGYGNPYFEQGNIHLKKKQYHKAIEQYSHALRLNPDSAVIHAALGWAYYNVGKLDAAIAEGEEVMRLEPENNDVQKLMDLLYQQRNRPR
jgi:tetratricopeptide (TPR) repeat protein